MCFKPGLTYKGKKMDVLPLEVKLEEFSDEEQLQEESKPENSLKSNMFILNGAKPKLVNGSLLDTNKLPSKTPFPMGQRVPCSYCEKTFKSLAIYRLHEKIHTGEGVYTCHYCQKVFGQRSHYVDHVAIHSTFRPFRCSECNSR